MNAKLQLTEEFSAGAARLRVDVYGGEPLEVIVGQPWGGQAHDERLQFRPDDVGLQELLPRGSSYPCTTEG